MNLGGVVHLNKSGIAIFLGCVFILFVYMLTKQQSTKEATESKPINLRELLQVSIAAAQIGGTQVVAIKDNLKIESKGKTKEGANDSVTTADYKSHCVMIQALKLNFPNLVVISEESKATCKTEDLTNSIPIDKNIEVFRDDIVNSNDITVWIDPLDATQEYTEKLYKYVTTMVCVAVKGKPVIGVIYKPFIKKTYWGWVDNGVSLNIVKVDDSPIEGRFVKYIVSRSHAGDVEKEIQGKFKNSKVIPAGGAGYKVLEVAEGNADVYYHITAIKKWDICAGNAILKALGGKMTTKEDDEIDYSDTKNVVNENGLIAALSNHDIYL